MTRIDMEPREVPRRRGLEATDARARIIAGSLSLIVAVSTLGSSPVTMAALCAFPAGALLIARVPPATVLRRLSFVAAFIALAGLFTFVVPLTQRPSPNRFGFLLFGSLFAVATAAAVAHSTTATEAMEALERLRIPHHVIWTGFLGIRYLPLVYGEGRRTYRAARARGWHGAGMRPLAWMSVSLVSRGFCRALRTGDAMEARGFGSGRVVFEPRPWTVRDWVVGVGYPAAILAVRLILDTVVA